MVAVRPGQPAQETSPERRVTPPVPRRSAPWPPRSPTTTGSGSAAPGWPPGRRNT